MGGSSPARPDASAPADGPADAFAVWVEPHLAVMSWTVARLAPPAERDDVLQEALMTAWRTWSSYDPERGSARTWLCVIAADRARKSRRHLGRRAALTPPTEPADHTEPAVAVDVERAVSTLPARQREAVSLRYFVGLSTAETAAVMGCSEGTVKSTLSDARTRLRGALGGDYR